MTGMHLAAFHIAAATLALPCIYSRVAWIRPIGRVGAIGNLFVAGLWLISEFTG